MHDVVVCGGNSLSLINIFFVHRYVICQCGCDIKVLSIKSGETVNILKGHTDLITSIIFNPSNQYQVCISEMRFQAVKFGVLCDLNSLHLIQVTSTKD